MYRTFSLHQTIYTPEDEIIFFENKKLLNLCLLTSRENIFSMTFCLTKIFVPLNLCNLGRMSLLALGLLIKFVRGASSEKFEFRF